MTDNNTAIVATLVPEDKRLSVLPDFFGFQLMLDAEALAFGYMSKLSVDYSGGYWHYYLLSNGGFYMAPAIDKPMRLEWVENYYEGSMTADAAGIVATLFMVNHLANKVQTDALVDLYYKIRDFALDHPEAKAIRAAID